MEFWSVRYKEAYEAYSHTFDFEVTKELKKQNLGMRRMAELVIEDFKKRYGDEIDSGRIKEIRLVHGFEYDEYDVKSLWSDEKIKKEEEYERYCKEHPEEQLF